MRRGNGDGSITVLTGRKKKYWARVTIGYDDEGRQLRKSLGSYKKRIDAEQALINYCYNPAQFDDIKLKDLFEKWKVKRFCNIEEATQKMYQSNWNYYQPIANIRVSELRTVHFQNIINNNIHLSRSYLKQIKSLGVQLCEYAIENDILDKNYAEFVELKKEERKQKIIFTDEQIEELFRHKGEFGPDTILVMIYTGMRVSEMLTLTKDKINIEEGYIQHGSKTDAGIDRIIPINAKIKDIVERYYNAANLYVFTRTGRQIRSDNYRPRDFARTIKELGFPSELTPHCCRHTYATKLNKTVANKEHIARLLGHTDYAITANIYTHTEINDLIQSQNSVT